MPDLGSEITAASAEVIADWNEDRSEAALTGLHRRRARTSATRGVLVFVVLIGAAALWRRPAATPVSGPVAIAPTKPAPPVVELAPGARAWPAEGAELRANMEDGAELVRGRAHFLVENTTADARFVLGPVVVKSRNARFAGEVWTGQARITVEEGSVFVFGGGRVVELPAGADQRFTSTDATPSPLRALKPSEKAPSPAAKKEPPPAEPTPGATPSWRALAAEGDYEAAHAALGGERLPEGDVAELLLVADVARLSHHAAEAEAPLETILRQHAEDPRAALAAFTLGRLRLEELGRPREAAEAFARAQALAPSGPLVEDAIAREVEAWSRAGESVRARARAEAYLSRYPEGRRIRAVRRFGGLD